jgi:hypothetical protein
MLRGYLQLEIPPYFTQKHLWRNVYGAFYLRSQVFDKEKREKPDPSNHPGWIWLTVDSMQ